MWVAIHREQSQSCLYRILSPNFFCPIFNSCSLRMYVHEWWLLFPVIRRQILSDSTIIDGFKFLVFPNIKLSGFFVLLSLKTQDIKDGYIPLLWKKYNKLLPVFGIQALMQACMYFSVPFYVCIYIIRLKMIMK